jgi:hypothetical protein
MKKPIIFLFLAFSLSLSFAQKTLEDYKDKAYDFIPANKILFFDDFAQEKLGKFPSRWETNSVAKVEQREKTKGNWLGMKPDGVYCPKTKASFSQDFSVEFDMIYCMDEDRGGNVTIDIYGDDENTCQESPLMGNAGIQLSLCFDRISVFRWEQGQDDVDKEIISDYFILEHLNEPIHVAISSFDGYLRVYVDNEKMLDLPHFTPLYDMNHLRFLETEGELDFEFYVSNLNISKGQAEYPEQVWQYGEWEARGIIFEGYSDKISPISYSVLQMLAVVLKENPQLKIKVVAHTDILGDVALAQKQANAVKNVLQNAFEIAGNRITAQGKGREKPIADNLTPEGRATNRRIVIEKVKDEIVL